MDPALMRTLAIILLCAGCLSAPNPALIDAAQNDGGDGDGDGDGGPADAGPDAEVPVTLGPIDTVTGIAAGWAHTCARFDNGAVRCWGRNAEGQLGQPGTDPLGDDEPPAAAGDLPLGFPVQAVAAGREHTCVLRDDGRVRCFGQGDVGQLGYGDTVDRDPEAATDHWVELGGDALAIAAGDYHTCALLEGGAVRCWGSNASGQLGVPGEPMIGDDETPASLPAVDLGDDAARIAAGGEHTCAILDEGPVRCWGSNASGQLGLPGVDMIGDDETPASQGVVMFGAPVAARISCGAAHTCVATELGELRCWGEGDSGRLGNDDTEDVGDDETPAEVGAVRSDVEEIAAGGAHTCVLVTGGAVHCWGAGADGALGQGALDDLLIPPVDPVELSAPATALVAGDRHSCALLDTGSVRCWGSNADGRVGKPEVTALGDDETPIALGGVQVLRVVEVACGSYHSCARIENGRVRCWGEGLAGSLGYGNDEDIGDDEPPADAGDVPFGGTALLLAAGKGHTCVSLAAGGLRCWGANEFGRNGNQTTAIIGDSEQALVAPLTQVGGTVIGLSTNQEHTCALLDDDSVRCWGRLLYGRLGVPELTEDVGDDEDPSSIDPVDLDGLVREIAVGDEHTCARMDGGAVRCWGHGLLGRLGTSDIEDIGDTEDPSSIPAVMVGGNAIQVSAGGVQTCALLEGGALRCWGDGTNGGLPYGTGQTVGDGEHPLAVGDAPMGGPVSQVASGLLHGCALMATGAVRCWGVGTVGAHGYGTTENMGDNEAPEDYGDVQLF